jgi:hypothetical protein
VSLHLAVSRPGLFERFPFSILGARAILISASQFLAFTYSDLGHRSGGSRRHLNPESFHGGLLALIQCTLLLVPFPLLPSLLASEMIGPGVLQEFDSPSKNVQVFGSGKVPHRSSARILRAINRSNTSRRSGAGMFINSSSVNSSSVNSSGCFSSSSHFPR